MEGSDDAPQALTQNAIWLMLHDADEWGVGVVGSLEGEEGGVADGGDESLYCSSKVGVLGELCIECLSQLDQDFFQLCYF